MGCNGLHCSGCSHGGRGGGIALVVIIVIVILASIRKAAGQAIATTEHVLSVVLEVVVIVLASTFAVLVAWGLVLLARRVVRWHHARARALPLRVVSSSIVASEPEQLEAPKPQLTGLDTLVKTKARTGNHE